MSFLFLASQLIFAQHLISWCFFFDCLLSLCLHGFFKKCMSLRFSLSLCFPSLNHDHVLIMVFYCFSFIYLDVCLHGLFRATTWQVLTDMFSRMSMCHLLDTHNLLSMTMKLLLIESCYPITQALQIQHLLQTYSRSWDFDLFAPAHRYTNHLLLIKQHNANSN